LKLRFEIFRRGGNRAGCSAPRIKPLAQLDDVLSILRLSYETLKGLISLAARGVAKLTLYGTLGAFPDFDDWALTAESAD
jgi:hypothetical protein